MTLIGVSSDEPVEIATPSNEGAFLAELGLSTTSTSSCFPRGYFRRCSWSLRAEHAKTTAENGEHCLLVVNGAAIEALFQGAARREETKLCICLWGAEEHEQHRHRG